MPVIFHSKSPDYAWLTNFSEDAFTLIGVRWASVEHYYQAQKYAGTGTARRIREAESPLKARKAGQDRSPYPRSDWETVKKEVTRKAAGAKFRQNPMLRDQLLATGDEELIDESRRDLFRGRNADGDGENGMGEILMEIRQQLRDETG